MDIEAARQQMLDQQVRAWEVLDPRVLAALARVPRERFTPAAYREVAFADAEIPLPAGQSMLPPKIEGRMLQALEVVPGDTVLEVGSGSGFFAACLAELGGLVRTLELHAELADFARTKLRATGRDGVVVETADAFRFVGAQPEDRGWDVVVLTGSLPLWDERFATLLAPGGRLLAVVGEGSAMQARLVVRGPDSGGGRDYATAVLFETSIAPLLGARRPSRFVF